MPRARTLARSWEGFLLLLLLLVIVFNAATVTGYIGLQNQSNLLVLGLEKAIVALAMAFVIISGEIDLSVASVMGLAGVVTAAVWQSGVPIEVAALAGILVGVACGLFNGFWVAIVGLPSLVVTLAGLIGFRGLAYFIVEDDFISGIPDSFKAIAQDPFLGPAPFTVLIYAVLAVLAVVALHASGFGRYVYVLGNSRQVARYSGVRVARMQLAVFTVSGVIAALAGVIYAARLGAVRGSTAEGFELEIITMVLLGGVSIFGGKGTVPGVILATLLVLNLRNGMDLARVPSNVQEGIIGSLLILSVLLPNVLAAWSERRRRAEIHAARASPATTGGARP
jgi:rhamnose transport system permease protein